MIVAQNTPSARRDVDPLILKVFYLDPSTKEEVVGEIGNAIRTRLQLREIYWSGPGRVILVRDTPATLAQVERVISEVSPQSLPLASSAPLRFPESATHFLSIAENAKVRRVLPSTESHMENMLVGSVEPAGFGDVGLQTPSDFQRSSFWIAFAAFSASRLAPHFGPSPSNEQPESSASPSAMTMRNRSAA